MPKMSIGVGVPGSFPHASAAKDYSFLQTQPELVFKNIVKLLSQVFEVPFAFISLIDNDRIFFKADYGAGTVASLSSNKNFCALINRYKETPAYMHRFSEKVVLENPGSGDSYDIRFYASVPLVDSEGHLIGNVCLADIRPRKFTAKDKLQLHRIAAVVRDEIELRKSTLEEAQKLIAINKSLKESIVKPRYLVLDAPAALGVLSGRNLIIESANNELLTIWGKEESVIGKSLKKVRTEESALPFLRLLDEVFVSGKPYFGNEVMYWNKGAKDSKPGYFNFVYHPLKNSGGIVIGIFIVGVDVTKEIEGRKKVERMESLLRMATDAGKIGTWYINAETREFIPSPRLKKIFGYGVHEEMPLETALSQVAEDYRKPLVAAMEACLANGEKFDVEFPFTTLDSNSKRWVKAIGKLYAASEGIPNHFSGTMIDITEGKKNDELKNDFISIVSHDLKTPLTSLRGCIQLLQEGYQEMGHKFEHTLMTKADKMIVKMANMIDGYLDVKRLEAGKLDMHLSSVNLRQVIKAAVGQVKSNDAGGHQFHISCARSVVCTADKTKIEQVLQNLLNNSVKYSAAGSEIKIDCIEENRYVTVSVQDYGKGILQKDLSKLFGRFYRGDAENSSMPGFGVGLYICSEIVHGHRGSIWAESEPGKGSVFYFQLPKYYEVS